ncbi:MAG: Peptidoglycan binding protein [Conexibacter sp.]|nr:Peptidoglycan binding protein [Conexibacter sp.]
MSTKSIVIACDGTWNRPDQISHGTVAPTNVTKIALAVPDADGEGREQKLFYEPGVGTRPLEHLRGGAFGIGISRNIRDCYRFLAKCYAPGDDLYLFGFSRGAFTARSIAGLIGNCGILQPEHVDRVDDAYRLYRNHDAPTRPSGIEARVFRRMYAYDDVPIRFVGVWDTVGALGIPTGVLRLPWLTKRWAFHDVRLGAHVRTACHALAIDERRGPFAPTLWTRQDPRPADQTLDQVWFSGVHCDVGGGPGQPGLAEIPLLWMAERAAQAGLAFKDGWFMPTSAPDPDKRHVGQEVSPDALADFSDSRKGQYRLVAPNVRTLIGTDRGSPATSAWRRVREKHGYDPPNLRAYLATDPAPTEVRDRV